MAPGGLRAEPALRRAGWVVRWSPPERGLDAAEGEGPAQAFGPAMGRRFVNGPQKIANAHTGLQPVREPAAVATGQERRSATGGDKPSAHFLRGICVRVHFSGRA